MDIPAKDLEKLKCSTCKNYLSRGPVYLQHDGAALCGRCYAPKRRAVRNIQYEITAKFLRFPCKNKDYGCRETVPFVDKDVEIPHEKVCEHRQYACPLLGPNCNWVGMRRDILQHCKEEHPDSVVGNPTTIVHDICKASTKTYLLRAFEVLFLLHTKMCLISGKLFHTVSYLGASTEATKYDFTLDIKRNDLFISKPGIVIPHQPTREDLSLGLTTKSLLDFLDGFDGTTFTVTVKQKSDQATKRADVVQCAECETEISVFRYRDSRGWLCECCAPARRACKNQGCAYVDIDEKSEKHEWWFCQQRTRCGICDVAIPRGTLSAHYSFEHQGDTYTTGSTWRATRTGRCLVSTTAGIAACEYMLFNTQFVLGVYIPVPSEQLKEFRCEVKLTNPATGDRNTYSPDTLYNELWDWNVVVKMEEFQPWSTEFDVVVDVVQCKTFEHQGDTYTTGTTWRATRTGRCLVSTTAGIAACEYMLFNTQFVLGVYIPVPSEQLKEFRCEVKLTNPTTGDRNTYTPDTLYNELWDWNVVVKMEEFQPWSTEFDVVVDVVQCKS